MVNIANLSVKFLFFVLFLAAGLIVSTPAMAQEEPADNEVICEVEDGPCPPRFPVESTAELPGDISEGWGEESATYGANCFDYYRFQSVQVSVGTDKDLYTPGARVKFSGELINENNYPVVDGYVFVRISRANGNYVTEGRHIIDEFLALEHVALDGGATSAVNFEWVVPVPVIGGDYRADYFFSVGKKFNLGGLPFTNEVIVGAADFEIDAPRTGLYFDRSATLVNGGSYQHIGSWPNFPAGSKAAISQSLKNLASREIEAAITYDLYYWDSLDAKDRIASRTEKVSVPAGSSATLTYEIPSLAEPVYYLKITAESGGQKSIVNIRLASNLERPRLNYPALTKFPLEKGDVFTLFSCLHNTSGKNTDGKMILALADKNGKPAGGLEYSGPISSMMMAVKEDLTSEKSYDYLRLTALLLDKNGKTVDAYETVYDCNEINPMKCQKSYLQYYLGGAVILLIAVLGFWLGRKKSATPVFSGLATFFFIILLSGFFVAASPVEAYNEQSKTASSAFSHYIDWVDGCGRSVSGGQVSVLHKVEMTAGNYSVLVGAPINFSYNPDKPFFNAYGGNWDTPYGDWCSSINNYCMSVYKGQPITGSGRVDPAGYILWTGVKPAVSVSSNNSSIISCSGMACTAKSPGTAVLTANVGQTTMRIWSIIYSTWCYENDCGRGSGLPRGWHWLSEGGESGLQGGDIKTCTTPRNKMNLSATSMSWTVNVVGPTVDLKADGSDGPITKDYNDAAALSWTSTNATSCTASNGWSGSKGTSGSQSTGALTTSKTYTLTCSDTAGNSGSDSVTVNVNPPQYTSCSGGACVVVPGVGTNSCASNVSCGGGGGGGQEHLDCRNNACVWVSGPGYDQCASNFDCGGTEHSVCVNKACVIVPGAGANSCRNNVDCGGTLGDFYGACSQGACVKVDGVLSGENSFACNVDADCGSGPSYALRSGANLSIVVLDETKSYCSNKTKITALPYRGFASDVELEVIDWGGFAVQSSDFSVNPLSLENYSSGSQFSVCNKPGASPGPYTLKIEGTGGQTVTVKLNLVKKSPEWQETSLWRLLASIGGWFKN